MYRPTPSNRDRAATIAAVVLIHVGLAYAFLNVSGPMRFIEEQADLQIFDIADPPPPPIVEILPEPERAKPKEEEGAAAPKNIESKATPVVVPKPRVVVPAKTPVVAAPVPNTGAAPTQGASPVPGPGTGAGGTGTGTGSGGAGSGRGGGGSGGEGVRPALISRKLTPRDYPSSLRRQWPSGGRVLVIFSVQLDGRATGCTVHTSSGVPAIDQVTCSLVENRLRFRPARDERGVPFVEKFAYMQAPVNF